jgi:hypothetical protein
VLEDFTWVCAVPSYLTNQPTDWLTNKLKKNLPSEANSRSVIQEVLHLLWNLKVHYPVDKILQMGP